MSIFCDNLVHENIDLLWQPGEGGSHHIIFETYNDSEVLSDFSQIMTNDALMQTPSLWLLTHVLFTTQSKK